MHSYDAFHTRFVGPGVKGIIVNAQVQLLSCRCLVVVLLWCENTITLNVNPLTPNQRHTAVSVDPGSSLNALLHHNFTLDLTWLVGWLVEWGFYALSASKAIFRARTYNCNLFTLPGSGNIKRSQYVKFLKTESC